MKPELVKLAARVCLGVQLTGVLSCALVPVMALANEKVPARMLFSSRTALYTFKAGDTVASVANQFGLSVAELRTLNEFRKYNKPFDKLSTGDEVDVPVQELNLKSTPQAGQLPNEENSDEQFWATNASRAGTLLTSDDIGHSVSGMARGAATNAVNGEVEKWLSQFGTARVDLGVDEDFNLDDSSIDVLLPVYDSNDHIVFTQLGYRHKNDRDTVNVGLGFRTFQGNWMYGINTFYDDDITGHNRRIGFGLEAWTDYLRFSANSYSGITDWHQSRDFADYDERPADGFDIRMEGWLPAYPQLGGKLMYEQYRGKEVALYSKDERLNDPRVITLGINYTPVPLVTVGIDHHHGGGSTKNTELNLEFNYRLGVPWSEQVDPSAVGFSRTLAGSRYDLVDRNNDVVLEYKKQEVISLGLPPEIVGQAGNTTTVTAVVKSKYGVERVEWDASELIAKGGGIDQHRASDTTVQLTLPPYDTTRGVNGNQYHISAVAYDIKGNKSNRGTTDILVTAPQIANGELELVADNATDDGVAINTVSARLTDISNNPVSGVTVHFSADNEAAVVTPLVVTDDNGIATTNLTSTTAGVTNVIAEVNGNTRTVAATFVAGSDSAVIQDGDLVMIVDNAIADNTDANTVQAKVTNSSGNAVPDVTVNFSTAITGVTITAASVTTDSDGLAKTNITSTRDGSGPITAEINGNSQSVNATFVPDNSSATLASDSLVVTANNAAADGSDTNAVEVMVVDESNNPLPNVKVNFATTNGAAITPSVVTDAAGKAATTLTNTMAGTASVTAEVNGSSQTVDTTFVADSTTATVTLTSDKNEQPADGSSAVAVTATVKDVNGNLLTGEKITFTTTGEALFSGDVTTFTAATNSDGQVVADITDTAVENVMVTATPESNASGSANKSLTFAEVPTSPFPATTKILVNGETFGVSDGFPKTGFRNAQFQFAVGGDVANNSNYTWSVEEGSWLRVDPNTGTVTFTSQGSNAVIRATPKTGSGALEYTVNLNTWFIRSEADFDADGADAWCATQGAVTPSYTQLTNDTPEGSSRPSRGVGQLWSEWGDISSFDGYIGFGNYWWTSELYNSSTPYVVSLSTGGVTESYPTLHTYAVACAKGL